MWNRFPAFVGVLLAAAVWLPGPSDAQVTSFVATARQAVLFGGSSENVVLYGGALVEQRGQGCNYYASAGFYEGNSGFRCDVFGADCNALGAEINAIAPTGFFARVDFLSTVSVSATVTVFGGVFGPCGDPFGRDGIWSNWVVKLNGVEIFNKGGGGSASGPLEITPGAYSLSVEGGLSCGWDFHCSCVTLGARIEYGTPDPLSIPPEIVTDILPRGTNGQPYATQLFATGSPSPSFSLAGGILPPGLTLTGNGLITGTPTTHGEFAVTIRADNGVAPADERSYTLVVLAPVVLAALEAVQSIQTWSNDVRLLRGKRTMVRAHVLNPIPGTNIARVSGLLHGETLNGDPLPGSPLRPIPNLLQGYVEPPTNLSFRTRGDSEKTLNFDLPTGWLIGTNVIRVELVDAVQINQEPAEQGGVEGDGRLTLRFRAGHTLSVNFVPVTWIDNATTYAPPSAVELYQDIWWLKSMYPVEDVEWRVLPGFVYDGSTIALPDQLSPLLNRIAMLWLLEDRPYTELYYGTFNLDRDMGGLAQSADNKKSAATGKFDRSLPAIFTHEVGHLLGLPHATSESQFGQGSCAANTNTVGVLGPCGECSGFNEPAFPYFVDHPSAFIGQIAALGPYDGDPRAHVYGAYPHTVPPKVYGLDTASEMMSYCGGTPWLSKHNYLSIDAALNERLGAPGPLARGRQVDSPPKPANSGPATNAYLIISGTIDTLTGDVSINPAQRVMRAHPLPAPEAGPYTIWALDAASNIVRLVSFAPDTGSEFNQQQHVFAVPVRDHPDIRRLQVVQDVDVRADIAASLNTPTVTLLAPNGGEVFDGDAIPVSWAGDDLDGQPLTYTLYYSRDGGSTWTPVAFDLVAEQYNIPRHYVPGSTSALVRVVAGDGFWTTDDDSDAVFEVAHHAPRIGLLQVPEDVTLGPGDRYRFTALAYDVEDGVLPDASIIWYSSLDGVIATGAVFEAGHEALSTGQHQVSAVATDRDGLTATSTAPVHITLVRPARMDAVDRMASTIRLKGVAESPRELVVQASTNMSGWQSVSTTYHAGVVFEIPMSGQEVKDAQAFRIATRAVNLPPTIAVTAPSNGFATTIGVPFIAEAVVFDPNGDPVTVTWTVYDAADNVVTQQTGNPAHITLGAAGLYRVQGSVTDVYGLHATGSVMRTVQVYLGLGAIAFTGFNALGDDHLAFVALEEIPGGVEIFFSDNEWNGGAIGGGGAFSDLTESVLRWTAPTAGVSAGTVVLISGIEVTPPLTTSTGAIAYVIDANVGVGSNNEAVYAYQGGSTQPRVFLAAIGHGTIGSAYTTLNGTGLVIGETVLHMGPPAIGIMAYNGPRAGQASHAAYRAQINNPTNWITETGTGVQGNSIPPDVPFDTTPFTVTP